MAFPHLCVCLLELSGPVDGARGGMIAEQELERRNIVIVCLFFYIVWYRKYLVAQEQNEMIQRLRPVPVLQFSTIKSTGQ